MKTMIRLSLTAVFLAALTPLNADVTPTDVKNKGNESAATIQKNKDEAVKKATTDSSAPAKPKKKKRSFFDKSALSKDRSLPADEKVPVTDDKPVDPPYKHLNQDLHKDRG